MQNYLDLMRNIRDNGIRQKNRTGIDTLMLPGAMMQFDLRKGFPAVTTKKLFYGAVVGELIGFLRGCDTAVEFNELGCKVWDANAKAPAWINNPNYIDVQHLGGDNKTDLISSGYLGRIYGKQWRTWRTTVEGRVLDQIQKLLDTIYTDPTSRRMLVTAWRPDELDQMALPPCHYGFQVIIEQETKVMHLLWNQRSVDVFLGLPFNIASYATLLTLLAKLTGYTPGILTGFLADVHLYESHLLQVEDQLLRSPYELPTLDYTGPTYTGERFNADIFNSIEPGMFNLTNYKHWSAIKAPMAV